MNAATNKTTALAAEDVIREGNVAVILPWDGRVGELWWDRSRRLFGMAGLNGDRIPARFLFHATWADLKARYARHDAMIRRAPAGARTGDLIR